MTKDKLAPPEPTRKDAIIEGIKAGLSGPGGIVAALLKTPLERRRDEWMKDVERVLLELDGKLDDFSFDALAENELFISTCVSAAQAAMRTHVLEKRTALRNAVLSTAIFPKMDETKVQIFMNMLDGFTEWHIRILHLLSDPELWDRQNEKSIVKAWVIDGVDGFRLIRLAYPELIENPGVLQTIVQDLEDKDFLLSGFREGSIGRFELSERQIITKWGKEFLKFIQEPITP